MKPKIVIDKNIPFILEALEGKFNVISLPANQINKNAVKDATAMLIRTRTLCNKELLEGSTVKFIGTATIGYDHIDLDWCKNNEITVKTAAGCNAGGVVNYVLRCLIEFECVPAETTIGIIGVGNVGSLLNERLTHWGFKTLLCDPIRAINEPLNEFLSYEDVLKNSDVVTFHTPLTYEGEHKTFELLNKKSLEKCKNGVKIINSSRGEIVNDSDLVNALKKGKVSSCAIDVWNNEPNINLELLGLADITTPHIAGYSVQGKANGSAIVVNELFRHQNHNNINNWYPKNITKRTYLDTTWEQLKITLTSDYKILDETNSLKNNASNFEKFRNEYNFRNEIL
ncbi:MAG: 4-phosphoerythronate dehydrogenase [Rikenellaceae bacterium]